MQAKIQTKPFREAFGLIGRLAGKNNTRPALASVLLATGEDGSTLYATDTEVSARIELIGCEVDRPGKVLLPAAMVGKIVAVADEQVSLSLDGEMLTIRSGSSRWAAPVRPVDELPLLPLSAPEGSPTIRLPAATLSAMIGATAWACDPNSTQYALGGCQVEWTPESASLIALDGIKIAAMEAPAETDGEWDGKSRVIPVKALKFLRAALDSIGESDCELSFDGSSAFVLAGGMVIGMRLCEGRFPKWRKAVPEHVSEAIVPADAMRGAIDRVSIGVDDSRRKARLSLSAGKLQLEATEGGEAETSIDAGYDAEPASVLLCVDYLADAARPIKADSFAFRYAGPTGMVGIEADGYTAYISHMTEAADGQP